MPHILIKMLEGRTEEQKKKAAEAVKQALMSSIGAGETHISVSVDVINRRRRNAYFGKR